MEGLIGKYVKGWSRFQPNVEVAGQVIGSYIHHDWTVWSLLFGNSTVLCLVVKTDYGTLQQIAMDKALKVSDKQF